MSTRVLDRLRLAVISILALYALFVLGDAMLFLARRVTH